MINLFEDITKKSTPTAEIEYDITEETTKNVTAKLINPSTEITITNNNRSDTYVFTENGEFTFEFVDNYGNIGSTTARVNWIIKGSDDNNQKPGTDNKDDTNKDNQTPGTDNKDDSNKDNQTPGTDNKDNTTNNDNKNPSVDNKDNSTNNSQTPSTDNKNDNNNNNQTPGIDNKDNTNNNNDNQIPDTNNKELIQDTKDSMQDNQTSPNIDNEKEIDNNTPTTDSSDKNIESEKETTSSNSLPNAGTNHNIYIKIIMGIIAICLLVFIYKKIIKK